MKTDMLTPYPYDVIGTWMSKHHIELEREAYHELAEIIDSPLSVSRNQMTPEQLREEIIADFYKIFSEENVWQGEDEYTKNVPIGNLEQWLRTALTTTAQRVREEMIGEMLKRADMELYALENTLEKSKELPVAVGHKRVYERLKLISEYKGKLEVWKEIKEDYLSTLNK